MSPQFKLSGLLCDAAYKLTQFKPEQIQALEDGITMRGVRGALKPQVKGLVRANDAPHDQEEFRAFLWLNDLALLRGYFHSC